MTENTTQTSRLHMVKSQIATNKVGDQYVLAALEVIPREEFVPEKYRGVAYLDDDLPIGEGRILMEPMIFARLLQLADISKDEKVLVIGAATGYPVAVISQLAGEVVGLEDNINFISAAQASLKKLQIANASFVKAELTEGAERQKPFDVIFINGAVEEVPKNITSQLKEGGRVITVKADEEALNGPYYAVSMHRHGELVTEQKWFQAFTRKLPGFQVKRGFEF